VVQGLVINRFGNTGISITGTGNEIEGNFIGTDPTGMLDEGNAMQGVNISGSNNTIGGTTPAARNVISGNDFWGVYVIGTTDTRIQGNFIGTTKNGTGKLGNYLEGVYFAGGSDNTVGGADAAAANTIAFNGAEGVSLGMLDNAFGTGNSILSNSIHSNGGLGINLNDNGVTANDAQDPDTGANNLQNYPTITSATTSRSTGRSIVRGTLNSTPGETFTIQLFINSAPDPSGFGEGQRLLRELSVTTDASGNASFGIKARKLRGFISATATNDASRDTSEFSFAKKVVRKR